MEKTKEITVDDFIALERKCDSMQYKDAGAAMFELAKQYTTQRPCCMTEERVREIAWIAWKGAANAFRLYPDNKHTFTEYWDAAKNQFQKFSESTPCQCKELREAVKEWEKVHNEFDTGYVNTDGKTTRMDIAALSQRCNEVDKKLRKALTSLDRKEDEK